MQEKIKYLKVKKHWFDSKNTTEEKTSGTTDPKKEFKEGLKLLRDPSAGWVEFKGKERSMFYNKASGLLFPDLSDHNNYGKEIDLYREGYPEAIGELRVIVPPFADLKKVWARTLSDEEFHLAFGKQENTLLKLGWHELNKKAFAVRPMKKGKPVYYTNGNKAGYWGVLGPCEKVWILFAIPLKEAIPDMTDEKVLRFMADCEMYPVYPRHTSSGSNDRRGVLKPDKEQVKIIREKLKKCDLKRTGSIIYDDGVYGPSSGHWELWKYVKYNDYTYDEILKETISESEQWADVSAEQFYAGDPTDAIGNSASVIAIDFGTKSTTVAWFDNKGNIATMPVGGGGNSSAGSGYENPTIMEYIDFESFYKAYRAQGARPQTDCRYLSTSFFAQNSFKQRTLDKNLNAYHYQLKQWTVGNMSEPVLVDQKKSEISLKPYLEQTEEDYDPIEVYAYYIGLNIINMKYRTIWLTYLLSYPPAYDGKVLNKISASFKRGLFRAMPEEVQKSKYFNDNFSVRLWQSEPAAYAVTALFRNKIRPGNEQILCGVYDFGGGTVDYSIGVFTGAKPPYTYQCLFSGGDTLAGCEVLLEELAYKLFFTCKEELTRNKVKFLYPLHYPPVGNNPDYIGESQQARLNTLAAVDRLRELWINDLKPQSNGVFAEFPLYPEQTAGRDRTKERQTEEKKQTESFTARVRIEGSVQDAADQETEARIIYMDVKKDFFKLFFKEKICKSAEHFYSGLEKELEKIEKLNHGISLNGTKFRLFLGGNASRASLVKEIFENMVKTKPRFRDLETQIFEPMSAKQEEENWAGELPTAKTGVVHGLLHSRKGSPFVKIKGGEVNGFRFKYWIGHEEFDPDTFEIFFCVDHAAKDFQRPENPDRPRETECRLLEIKEEGFVSFRYTMNQAVEAVGRIPLADSQAEEFVINSREIKTGRKIYLTVSPKSDDELLVYLQDESGIVSLLGYANLKNGHFDENIEEKKKDV